MAFKKKEVKKPVKKELNENNFNDYGECVRAKKEVEEKKV